MYVSGGAEGSVGRDVRVMWTEGAERCVSGSVWGVCGDEAGRCVFRQTQRYGTVVRCVRRRAQSDLFVKQCRAMCFPWGTKRYVCKPASSDVCVREERDDACVIGRGAVRVSGGAERWQRRTQGSVRTVGAKRHVCRGVHDDGGAEECKSNLIFGVHCLFRDRRPTCMSDTHCV